MTQVDEATEQARAMGGPLHFEGWQSFGAFCQFLQDNGLRQLSVELRESVLGPDHVWVFSYVRLSNYAEDMLDTRRVEWRGAVEASTVKAVQRALIARGFVVCGNIQWGPAEWGKDTPPA